MNSFFFFMVPNFYIFSQRKLKIIALYSSYPWKLINNDCKLSLEFEKKLSDLKFLENNIFKKIFKPVNSKKAHVFDLISF